MERLEADQPREAAMILAEILSRNPDLVRVRLELARAYFVSEQWARARSEFLSVLSSGDIPELVRQNILRFLRAIDARRGFDWDADFSLVRLGATRNYASNTLNLNLGGATLPFTLNRDNESVIGLGFSLNLSRREELPFLSGSRYGALGFARIFANGETGRFFAGGENDRKSEHDDISFGAEVGMRFVWPTSSITVAPSVRRRIVEKTTQEDRVGARVTFLQRDSHGTTYSFSPAWYDINSPRDDSRDGRTLTLSASLNYSITPRASLGAQLYFEDRDADSLFDDYKRSRLTAYGGFDAGFGIGLQPSAYIERRTFDQDSLLYGGLDELNFGMGLTIDSSRIILPNGFTPYIRLGLDRIGSSVEAFSYWEPYGTIGLERHF
ncbi:MAG: DUF560 domain-containing protein [Rhodospirillales bacterium]|nr:DUF560 domain-containing protein [Rhodospirillales bacterium]